MSPACVSPADRKVGRTTNKCPLRTWPLLVRACCCFPFRPRSKQHHVFHHCLLGLARDLCRCSNCSGFACQCTSLCYRLHHCQISGIRHGLISSELRLWRYCMLLQRASTAILSARFDRGANAACFTQTATFVTAYNTCLTQQCVSVYAMSLVIFNAHYCYKRLVLMWLLA